MSTKLPCVPSTRTGMSLLREKNGTVKQHFLNNLTDWSTVECVPLLSANQSAQLVCLQTVFKNLLEIQYVHLYDSRGQQDFRRRIKRASHLEDGSGTVMNGQDVCNVVSG